MTSLNSRLDTIIISDRMQMIEWVACVASVSVRFRSKLKNEERASQRLLFHFSRGQNRESRSSVFLCYETKRKRLLRRLETRLPFAG